MARISSGVVRNSLARIRSKSTPSRANSMTFSRTKPVPQAGGFHHRLDHALGRLEGLFVAHLAGLLQRDRRLHESHLNRLGAAFLLVYLTPQRHDFRALESPNLDREAPFRDFHGHDIGQVLRGLDLLKRADLLGWHFACSLR